MNRTFWLTIGLIGAIPLFFLPLTKDYYETNKWALLLLIVIIGFCIRAISLLTHPTYRMWHHRRESIAFGLIALSGYISVAVSSTNKIEALIHPYGPLTFTALFILMAITPPFTADFQKYAKTCLYTVASILGILAIYQWLGMGKSILPSIPFLADPLWTPTGFTTATIALLVIVMTLLTVDIARVHKQKQGSSSIALFILSLLVIAAGLAVTLWQIIPTYFSTSLPMGVAWSIFLESLKQTKSAIAGVGAENFLTAYTRGRPASIALTPLWNVRFATSANFFLHIATTTGLLGFVSTIPLIYLLKTPTHLAILLSLLLVPPSITLLVMVAAIFFITEGEVKDSPGLLHRGLSWTKTTLAICILIGTVAALYLGSRVYRGEFFYYRAVQFATNSEGTNAYNTLIQAIQANPNIGAYHILLSQISIAIANSVAGQPTKDQQIIQELIGQAVTQAKIAVAVNPISILAWENLARVYEAIVPIAQGADAWAQTSYTKALSLDPSNPSLVLALGGILIHEKKYDEAAGAFQRAIALRPTYINAYYNLANAYRLAGDNERAIEALTKTLSFVNPDSVDYDKVTNELKLLTR